MFIVQIYSSPGHHESQAHKYAAMWTIQRTSNMPAGCHFFLSKYGIRIQQAPNTAIVWLPEEDHASSLPNYNPKSPNFGTFCQRSVAFVTSKRLGTAWKKLCSHTFTREQALKFATEFDESDIKYV